MNIIIFIDYEKELVSLSSGDIIPLDRFTNKIKVGNAVFINELGKFYSIQIELECPTCGER